MDELDAVIEQGVAYGDQPKENVDQPTDHDRAYKFGHSVLRAARNTDFISKDLCVFLRSSGGGIHCRH